MSTERKVVILLCDDDPNLDGGNDLQRDVLKQCFALQKPPVELEILECTHHDQIASRLDDPRAADGVDLALVDAYYGTWTGEGPRNLKVIGEEDYSESIVSRFGKDPRIDKLIVFTGKPREDASQARLIDRKAYEYWNKNDFLNVGSFKRRLEELLDLPSRYDLASFEQVFAQGIYAEKKFDFNMARKEVENTLKGEDLGIRRVKRLIFEASQFDDDVPVLVTGETGTGKELIVKLIHRLSRRGRVMHRDDPVTINCGLFHDDNLLRAELFGTHRGAFTGAIEREGILEAHRGTTLFLDEVGNSTKPFQASLLRAIENREGARLGSSRSSEYRIDLRFIAATDKDVNDTDFSRPFLNRIRGLHIHIPPLRERRSDISLLADHFLKGPVESSPLELTIAAKKALVGYDWPGNVRQLRHVMEIVSQRARNLRPSDYRTTSNLIYRDEIEVLFSTPSLSAASSARVDPAAMVADNPSYSDACDRFAGFYVRRRHDEITGGGRTNDAYDRTAAALGVSRSTVKKWLQPTEPSNEP